MKTRIRFFLAGVTAVAASLTVCVAADNAAINQTASAAPAQPSDTNKPVLRTISGYVDAPFQWAQTADTNKPVLKVVKVDSEETAGENGRGTNAVDGNPSTIWHTQWQDDSPGHPHEIIIELTPPSTIKGFTYLPRQDDSENGTIADYEFYVSNDGKDFGKPVKKGTLLSGKDKKTVTFEPVKCRFIKLKALSEVNNEAWTSAAEIGVIPSN
jgi:hypothetical protein